MRPIHVSLLLIFLTLISSCKEDNVRIFYKQTDIAKARWKGKVRSVVNYNCSLDSSRRYCSVSRKEYNERGYLTLWTDTTLTSGYSTHEYFYNEAGLLAKQIFTSHGFNDWEKTYVYSFPERKKITVLRENNEIDSTISLYDGNGNEISSSSGSRRYFYEYDEHGFMILERNISITDPQDIFEIRYINNANGRILKATRSDGFLQTMVYNKDGNLIQMTSFDKSEKIIDWLYGYCEFDKNGNCLKRISMSPFMKEVNVDSLVFDYY